MTSMNITTDQVSDASEEKMIYASDLLAHLFYQALQPVRKKSDVGGTLTAEEVASLEGIANAASNTIQALHVGLGVIGKSMVYSHPELGKDELSSFGWLMETLADLLESLYTMESDARFHLREMGRA